MIESFGGPAGAADFPEPIVVNASPSAAERLYHEPQLKIYGSLPVITAAVGAKGKKDGAGNRRTGF